MKTVLFIDLDGTLIKTKSGKNFPEGIWDMEIRMDVLNAIKNSKVKTVHIISNQGGIEKGLVNELQFASKLRYLENVVRSFCGVKCSGDYCGFNNPNNSRRKPNTGMIEGFLSDSRLKEVITKSDCIMVGDASGIEGQFSDSDLKTAENAGIDYLDVSAFIEKHKTL